MTKFLRELKGSVGSIVEKAKVRKGVTAFVALVFCLQLYFVRELLAAELLFVAGFGALLAIGATIYVVGAIGERGLDFAEVGVRVIADSARRGYAGLEEISRKSIRRPRSETAL
jgi:hypothetical protein